MRFSFHRFNCGFPQKRSRCILLLVAIWLCSVVVACVTESPGSASRHRWWGGLGPVLPHDTFPSDCKLCHVGQTWNVLTDDFDFDHAAETGVPLIGSHAQAKCLRCHNDRGPISIFNAKGCVGCHQDFHFGELGPNCTNCHQQNTWHPVDMVTKHYQTRFPLVGVHVATACHRCHPGAFVGNFVPTPIECAACHAGDAAATTNPPHIPLNWLDHCDRCHTPTVWQQAELDPNNN